MTALFSNWIKLLKESISGSNTSPAAAGEGTPWKKFIFQDSFSSIVVRLNLARRSAQQTAGAAVDVNGCSTVKQTICSRK